MHGDWCREVCWVQTPVLYKGVTGSLSPESTLVSTAERSP